MCRVSETELCMTGSNPFFINVYDKLQDYQNVATLRGVHDENVISILKIGRFIVSSSLDKRLALWDSEQNYAHSQVLHNDSHFCFLVKIASDAFISWQIKGKLLVYKLKGSTLRLVTRQTV